jgi:hypothetical protein
MTVYDLMVKLDELTKNSPKILGYELKLPLAKSPSAHKGHVFDNEVVISVDDLNEYFTLCADIVRRSNDIRI